MKKLLICFVIISGAFGLNGCATLNMNPLDFSHINDEPTWRERAGFYDSCYPECDNNEKAEMLIDAMRKAGTDFTVVTQYYKIKEIMVFESSVHVWPYEQRSFVKGDKMYKEIISYTKGEKSLERRLTEEEESDDPALLGVRVDTDPKAQHKEATKWLKEKIL